ncbi:hypothetical protein [Sulfurimonas sp.]
MTLLSLFPIYGFTFFIFFTFSKKFSFSIFIAITLLIATSSIFAILGFLKIGVGLLYFIGLIFFIYYISKKHTQIIQVVKQPTFFIFTITIFWYWFTFKDSAFLYLDEFTHWGLVYKEMLNSNYLYDANSFTTHPYYPPASPVWQYFVSYFSEFNESNAYFAHFLIIASVLNMMYENISLKQFHIIVLIFMVQILCLANFSHGLNSIYVDHIISLVFLGIIFSILIDKYEDKSIWFFFFPLATLYLTKEAGLYFAIVAIGFFGLKVLLDYQDKKKTFLILFILLISLGFVYKGWNSRLETIGINKTKQSLSTVVKKIYKHNSINEEDKQIKERFIEIFFNQQISKSELSKKFYEFDYLQMPLYKDNYKLTTFSIIILYMLMLFTTYYIYRKKEYKKHITIYGTYILLITLVYIFIIYLSYFVAFDKQAFKIPSYIRYIHIAILPLMLFAFSMFLPLFKNDTKHITINSLIVPILVLSYLYMFETPVVDKLYKPSIKNNFRSYAQNDIEKIIQVSKPKEKIFVFFPVKDNGGMAIQLRYMLYPLKSTISSNDIFNYPKKNILEALSRYDYVWFPIKNKEAYIHYSKLLNTKTIYNLYKVEIKDNKMRLKPVL